MEITINFFLGVFVIILAAAIGFLCGMNLRKKHSDGTIIIEPTEDENREKVIWKLDMELDDIKKYSQVVFDVKNTTSKKSQLV